MDKKFNKTTTYKVIDETYGDGLAGNKKCQEWFLKFKEDVFNVGDQPWTLRIWKWRLTSFLWMRILISQHLEFAEK